MSSSPFVLMVAGPNGSGKTTLTEELRRRGVDLGEYINPDEIALGLEGDYRTRVAEAQIEADRRRDGCIAGRASFSFETVMSHPSKLEVLRRAKQAGFLTLLYFVATASPDVNVARVEQRVALGGHAVPEDRIRARYERTMRLLPEAFALADRVVLFDNTQRLGEEEPVILRPFLDLNRITPGRLHISPPIPEWGQALVDRAQTDRNLAHSLLIPRPR